MHRLLASRFARNWSALVLSNVASQALGMLATIRIARLLSPEGYGHYNLIQVIANLSVIAAGMGLRQVIIRETARDTGSTASLCLTALKVRLPLTALVVAGLLLYGWAVPIVGLPKSLLIVTLVISLLTWDLVESIAFGNERMDLSASINAVGSLLWAVAIWFVPASWITPLTVIGAFALLQCVEAIAYVAFIRSAGLLRGPARLAPVVGLMRAGLPFYWLALLTAATNQVPVLLLGARSGPAEVGLYNAGYRLTFPLQVMISGAMTALYPGLAQLSQQNNDHFRSTVCRAALGLALLGSAGALTVSLLRSELVMVIFGSSYSVTADAIAFQVWYTVIYSLHVLVGTVLAASDRQAWLATLSSGYAAFSLPILWWSAANAATGLALGILFAAVVSIFIHWAVLMRLVPDRRLLVVSMVILVSLLGAGLLAWRIPQTSPFFIRGGIALGFAACLVVLALREHTRHLLPSQKLQPQPTVKNS